MTARIGERIGSYLLREALGEGAMGLVFLGEDEEGRAAAVKVARPELARNEEFARRFSREFTAAADTVHPHLVQVLEHGEHGDTLFMVQEFMPGGSLADRLEREGRLGIEQAVRIARQLAGALDALHQNGLVHRDLKPANVLFNEEGDAHVADLGLVKDRKGTVITRPGQALGSMAYMSPEQVRGEDLEGTSDVYALGCVVYACVAGSAPFSDRRGMRVMWAHLQDDPGDACADRSDAPQGTGEAINLALAKEPGDRPPTATAYARMLRATVGVSS